MKNVPETWSRLATNQLRVSVPFSSAIQASPVTRHTNMQMPVENTNTVV